MTFTQAMICVLALGSIVFALGMYVTRKPGQNNLWMACKCLLQPRNRKSQPNKDCIFFSPVRANMGQQDRRRLQPQFCASSPALPQLAQLAVERVPRERSVCGVYDPCLPTGPEVQPMLNAFADYQDLTLLTAASMDCAAEPGLPSLLARAWKGIF